MKRKFKLLFLAPVFFAGTSILASCASKNVDNFDTSKQGEGTSVEVALPSRANDYNFGPYSEELYNLVHDAESHWTFIADHSNNQNGGFSLQVDGNESDGELLAKTQFNASNLLSGLNQLVFVIEGKENNSLLIELKNKDGYEKNLEANLTNEEVEYKLDISDLVLEGEYEITIKAKGLTKGSILIRSVHFAPGVQKQQVFNDDIVPIEYTGTKEMLLHRDANKHWTIIGNNYTKQEKYDDLLSISFENNEERDFIIKTTVVGSEHLRKFKSLTFNLTNTYTLQSNYKLILGNEEYSISKYASEQVISLENIDVTKNFDITFVLSAASLAYDYTTKVNLESCKLTPYKATPILTHGSAESANILDSSFYRWYLSSYDTDVLNHDGDKLIYNINDKTNAQTFFTTSFKNIGLGDFNAVKLKLKGVAGNEIKFYPYRAEGWDNKTGSIISLTGEEQEIIVPLNLEEFISGMTIYPINESVVNQGRLEISEIELFNQGNQFLKMDDIQDRVLGDNSDIDITDKVKELMIHPENGFSVDNDGNIVMDYTQAGNLDPLTFRIKRASVNTFAGYSRIKIVYTSTNSLQYFCAIKGSSNTSTLNASTEDVTFTAQISSSSSVADVLYDTSYYTKISPINSDTVVTIKQVLLIK